MHPNDTIYLYREPQTFLSFGAVGAQQQIPFGTWRLSLAEAISKSGGLVDTQADPASVFLYRGEARDVAEALGIDVSPYEGPVIPVIYTINLRDPAGLFLASSFEMRNKDILYASNSRSVEFHQVHDLSQQRQHDHSGTHHDRHERLWLAEYHHRHRRRAQHLRDRRIDHSRHVADALGLACDRSGSRVPQLLRCAYSGSPLSHGAFLTNPIPGAAFGLRSSKTQTRSSSDPS